MNKLRSVLLLAMICIASSACNKQQPVAPSQPAASQSAQAQTGNADKAAAPADAAPAAGEDSTPTAPAETK